MEDIMISKADEAEFKKLEAQKAKIEAQMARLRYSGLVDRRLKPDYAEDSVIENQREYSVKKTTEIVDSPQGVYVCEMEETTEGAKQTYSVRYQGILKINNEFIYVDSTEKTVYGVKTTRSFDAVMMAGSKMSKITNCEELHRQIEDRFLTMKSEVKNPDGNVSL